MLTTEQSLKKLFNRRGWHKNSGINESTARVYKKRFFENRIEMETQIKILEACGFKLIMEMQWEEEINHEQVKISLLDKLRKVNAFWSFDQPSALQIPDNILIEKVMLYLDIDDINSLFHMFPKKKIKDIWKNKILSQEPMYHQLNRLYAFLYFEIKNPDRYISHFISNKHKSIQCRD